MTRNRIVCLAALLGVMTVIASGCEWNAREARLQGIQKQIDQLGHEHREASADRRLEIDREIHDLKRDQDRVIDEPTAATGAATIISGVIPGGGSIIGLIGLLAMRRLDEAMREKWRRKFGTQT